MHGLHDVDQNDTIIGVPSSRRVLVLKASPLAFSTVTDGTCAAHTAEMKSAMLKRNVLIFYKFCLIINFLREKISGKITQKNPLFQFFLSGQTGQTPAQAHIKASYTAKRSAPPARHHAHEGCLLRSEEHEDAGPA